MEILRKPVVAYLITLVVVALSTGYLIVFAPQQRLQRVVDEDRLIVSEPDDETVELELEDQFPSETATAVYGLGDSFQFEGRRGQIELTFGDDISFSQSRVSIDGASEDRTVMVIPVVMTNLFSDDEVAGLAPDDTRGFGADGQLLASTNYNSGQLRDTDIRNINNQIGMGASFAGNLHILYDGDGKYLIEFGRNLSRFSTFEEEVMATLVFDIYRSAEVVDDSEARQLIQDYIDESGEGIASALSIEAFSNVEVIMGEEGNEVLILLTFAPDQDEFFIENFIPIFEESMHRNVAPEIANLREELGVAYLVFSHRFFAANGDFLEQLDLRVSQ